MESLANRVSQCPTVTVAGTWHRHAPARHAATALEGRASVSRWGTPDGFAVLHLGRPKISVIVEAYRHLVDPVENPDILRTLAPRVLVTCDIHVPEILDLRTATARMGTGLTLDVLRSDTRDRDAYEQCQEVAAVTRQLGLHGLIAPAATGLGETLALFPDRLAEQERPTRLSEEAWYQLPPDPRQAEHAHLRIVRDRD